MNIKELRDGNWFYNNTTQKPEIIDTKNIPIHKMRDIISPIELTDNWLKDFGFEPFKKGFLKENVYIEIYKGYGGYSWAAYEYTKETDRLVALLNFNYVHELQNHFYFETGKELVKQ